MSIGHKGITVKESKQVLQTSIVRKINIQFANSVVMSFSIRLGPHVPLCHAFYSLANIQTHRQSHVGVRTYALRHERKSKTSTSHLREGSEPSR